MGAAYARVLRQIPGVRLTAICDVVAPTLDAVTRDLGVPGYADYRAMLESEPGIDAVCVCTSDQAHVGHCVLAADMGKHLLVEKPLALSVADCEAIIGAARRSQVKLMVGHILRFDPRYALARQAVAEGRIGEPIHAFARRNNLLSVGRRIQGRTSVLYFLGIHDTDFLLWCLGERPTTVYAAATRRLLTDLGVDDSVFMTLRFPSGATACIEASWVLPETSVTPLDARLEIVGTQGAVYVDIHGQGLTIVDAALPDKPDTMYGPEVHGQITGILRDEIESFVRCIRDGSEPLITGEMGLEAARVIEAAHRSLESGSAEPV